MAIAILQIAFTVGSALYQRARQKKAQAAAREQAAGTEFSTEKQIISLPVLYGRNKIAGSRVYHNVSDTYYSVAPAAGAITFRNGLTTDVGGSKNEFLWVQQAIALGGLNNIKAVDIDEKSPNDDLFKPGLIINVYPNGNVADPVIIGNAKTMTNDSSDRVNAVFTNTAYASMVFKFNRDEPNYNGPPNVQFYVEGKKIRKINLSGSTYSLSTDYSYSDLIGSGPGVRGNNPALVLLDYLLDPLYGRGLDVSQVDLPSFYTAMNICAGAAPNQSAVTNAGKIWGATQTSGRVYQGSVTNPTTNVIRLYGDVSSTIAVGDQLALTQAFNASTATVTALNYVQYQPATESTPEVGNYTDVTVNNISALAPLPQTNIALFNLSGSGAGTRTLPLYEANITLDTKDTIRTNINKILDTMNSATLCWSAGTYKLSLLPIFTSNTQVDAAVALTLTEQLIVRDSFTIGYPSASDRVNRASVTFTNESKNFYDDTASWPVVNVTRQLANSATIGANTLTLLSAAGVVNGQYIAGGLPGIIDYDTTVTVSGNVITLSKPLLAAAPANMNVTFGDQFAVSYLNEDNGQPLLASYNEAGINDYWHALNKARERVLTSRTATRYEFQITADGVVLEPGDLIKFPNSANIGIEYTQTGSTITGDNPYARIEEVEVTEGNLVKIKAVNFDYTDVDWDSSNDINPPPVVVYDFTVAPPTGLYLTQTTTNASGYQLKWFPPADSRVTSYTIEKRTSADATTTPPTAAGPWITIGSSTTEQFDIDALSVYQKFDFAVRSVTIANGTSDYYDGNVLTDEEATPSGATAVINVIPSTLLVSTTTAGETSGLPQTVQFSVTNKGVAATPVITVTSDDDPNFTPGTWRVGKTPNTGFPQDLELINITVGAGSLDASGKILSAPITSLDAGKTTGWLSAPIRYKDLNGIVSYIGNAALTVLTVSADAAGSRTGMARVFKIGTATAPAAPTGTGTYTWASGGLSYTGTDGWSVNATAPTTGQTLYQATVTFTDNSFAATKTITDWSMATIVVAGSSGGGSGGGGGTIDVGWYDVTDYGAKGNGTTDDTASIQSAITLATITGGTVYFPRGLYKITSALTYTSVSTSDPGFRVNFLGDGIGASAIQQFTSGTDGLSVVGMSSGAGLNIYSTISNLTFIGAGGASKGISIVNAAYMVVNDCQVTGWGYGLYGTGALSLLVNGVKSRFNQKGILFDNTSQASNANAITLVGCHIGNNTDYGCLVTNAGLLSVTGGAIEGNAGYGLTIAEPGGGAVAQASVGCAIDGVYFENNSGTADIVISSTSPKSGVSNIITGCSFNRLPGNATNNILAGATDANRFKLAITGCGFRNYNGRTPSATTLNIVAQGNILDVIGCNFDSAVEGGIYATPSTLDSTVYLNNIGSGIRTLETRSYSADGLTYLRTAGSIGTGLGPGISTNADTVSIATGKTDSTGSYTAGIAVADGTGAIEYSFSGNRSADSTRMALGTTQAPWGKFYWGNTTAIPAPVTTGTQASQFLRGDGTWASAGGTVTGTGTVAGITLTSATASGTTTLTLGGALSVTTTDQWANSAYASNAASGTTGDFRIAAGAFTSPTTLARSWATVSEVRTGLNLPTTINTPVTTGYLKGDGTWSTPSGGSGTVTSVSGTGTVAGITLTGTVTSSGNLTLGGSLSVDTATQWTNSAFASNAPSTNGQFAIAAGAVSGGTLARSWAKPSEVRTVLYTAGTGISITASTTPEATASTIALSTPGNTTTWLRGDGTWTNTLTGDIVAYSDLTLKENFKLIKNPWGSFNGYQFSWKDTGKISYGFKAQDVQKEYPELVHEQADGKLALNYNGIIAMLWEQNKELNKRVKQLEEERNDRTNNKCWILKLANGVRGFKSYFFK